MISLIIIEVTQKIRIMENIMNRIFQKFLQSVIDLSSVGAKCLKDNTHNMDMNPSKMGGETLRIGYLLWMDDF